MSGARRGRRAVSGATRGRRAGERAALRALASALAVVAGAATAVAQAPITWTRAGGGGDCVVLGPATLRLAAPTARATNDAPGQYVVHFAADALGRPEPLALDVPAGADVQLATAMAGPATLQPLATKDAAGSGSDDGESWHWPRIGAPAQRLVLTLRGVASATLRARVRSHKERYALSYDRAQRTLRLDRAIGGPIDLLASTELPEPLARPTTLEFELHGFRLQAFVDGVRVLQVLDGAIATGDVGLYWRRDGLFGPGLGDGALAVGAPAEPRSSAALVRTGPHAATLYAASALPPGAWAIVELALDRPHALLPRDEAGLEPWLLQRPAAPVALLATPRQELGSGAFAETPAQGPARADLRWPALPALVGQCALARLLYVAADGSVVQGRSPAVSLRF